MDIAQEISDNVQSTGRRAKKKQQQLEPITFPWTLAASVMWLAVTHTYGDRSSK